MRVFAMLLFSCSVHHNVCIQIGGKARDCAFVSCWLITVTCGVLKSLQATLSWATEQLQRMYCIGNAYSDGRAFIAWILLHPAHAL